MKSIIFALVLIAAGVVGLGYYMGWIQFSSGSSDNKANITLSVNKDKIQEDKDKAVDKVHDLGQHAKDKTTTTNQKVQN